MRGAAASALLAALLALGGCSTPAWQAAQSHWPARRPPAVLLADTPFVPQQEDECGPAALAMLAQAAGRAVDAQTFKPQVFLPGRRGSLQLELPVAARRQGLAAYRLPIRPEDTQGAPLDALLDEVAAGHPVLVFLNLSLPIAPVWHYAVVIGYDREAQTLTLHSGTEAGQRWSLNQFERAWARAEHWAMLALDPARLPASLDASGTAAGLAALERLRPEAALPGYQAALSRWPDHAVLQLGLGNSAYQLGRQDLALQAYETLTRQHPELADGWNNLAQLRLERAELPGAAQAIGRAVQLGGPRLAQYQALQQRIGQALVPPIGR